MATQSRFRDKVVLVTGATSGIGEYTARALAAEGAHVVLAARRTERGEALARQLNEAGGSATFTTCDVTSRDAVAHLIQELVERFGRLDGAFNNAGIAGAVLQKVADISDETWDTILAANLTSVFTCMKYEIKAMLDSGGGVIVNNASIYGMLGSHIGAADYVVTKHAIMGLTKTAAADYAKAGIRINAICPGYTHSELVDPIIAADPNAFETLVVARVPMGRVADTAEISRGVLWLLSQESSFMTGQALVLDGGWTAI